MNFKSLFVALMAATGLLVACQEEKPVFGISADTDAIEFPQGGGPAVVQIATAQAWTVKIPSDAQDWLTAEPVSGTGNAAITLTAAANTGKDRKTGLKINAGMAGYVAITVTQPGSQKPGDGLTAETAWSASEANAWIKANLQDKEVTNEKYYVKGIIHKVQTTFAASGTYGNAVFYISDTGQAASDDFEAFQVYYLGGNKWKSGQADVEVGDEVIIYGPVTLYGSTAETSGKGAAYIYSHLRNGETPSGGGSGGGDNTDYSKAEAKTVKAFIEAADKDTYYKLSGTVGGSINTQYGNFDLTDDTGTIYVYGTENISEYASKLVKGASVVLAAKYDYYEKNSKHEAVHAYILSLEGGSQGGGGATKDPKAVTVGEFNAAPESEDQPYQLTGKVSNLTSRIYGNFDIVDSTGSVYVYGLTKTNLGYGAKNDQSFGSLGIYEGDEITIIGFRGSYNDKVEVVYAYWVAGGNGEGDNPGGGDGGEEDKDALTFQFSDLSGLSGWPTKADEAKQASTQVYKLNGVDYTFTLTPYIYTSTYNGASYLMLASKTNSGPVYLGLPAISGKKLVSVKITTSSGASANACGQITSDTNGTVVSGGEKKKLDTKNAEFSWTLSGTSANTVYYYSSTESGYNSQIVKLVLKYE